MLLGKSPTPLSANTYALTLPLRLLLFHLQRFGFYMVHSFLITFPLTSFPSSVCLFFPSFGTHYPYLPYPQCLQDLLTQILLATAAPEDLHILAFQPLGLQELVN